MFLHIFKLMWRMPRTPRELPLSRNGRGINKKQKRVRTTVPVCTRWGNMEGKELVLAKSNTTVCLLLSYCCKVGFTSDEVLCLEN